MGVTTQQQQGINKVAGEAAEKEHNDADGTPQQQQGGKKAAGDATE